MNATATPRPSFISVFITAMGAAVVTTCVAGVAAGAGNQAAPTEVATIDASSVLPADRATRWQPGMMGSGGIPLRSTICSTLSPGDKTTDDTARIQAAINVCPAGQVVQLSAGTFLINDGHYLRLNKGITLRGAGPGKTILAKTNGAQPFQSAVGAKPSPLVVVGVSLFSTTQDSTNATGAVALTADAVKGEYSITVTDSAGLVPGQIVLLDEASGATWQKDPQGRGQIWAAADWRVVWQKHNPSVQFVDDFAPGALSTTPGSAGSWFSRLDRPTAEIKEIASVAGSTVTFTTPIHITYRTGHAAQLSGYALPHVKNAGIEELTLTGGDAGNLRFNWAARSWAKNVESTVWHDEGIAIHASFGVELREFYVHDGAWAQPGGGGYAISMSAGSSDVLIENGIAVRANKVLVVRSAGAGSVVGYNYMDMGYINTQGYWIETGLNASHMVGPHHVLFEGNYGHNADSDNTHGNSIYLTFFRNHLRGIRGAFDNQAGGRIDDAAQSRNGPRRCAGLMAYSYWTSFVGNVLGAAGEMDEWVYEGSFADGKPAIWMLGWDAVTPYPTDAKVNATTLRHGNFDYLTNAMKWDSAIASRVLPDSLYLPKRPAFFDAGRGYAWPWVDPAGATKLHTLPAKARYDAGTPFAQP
jgi:Pectate lyase superfamily protein